MLTKYEKETIILFNDDDPNAKVYSYNKALLKQIKLIESKRDEISQTEDDGLGGLTFILPKKWIKIRPSRILSSVEKEKRAKLMKDNTHPRI